MPERNFYVGLVHHPVYNKNKSIVTTSITNMDVHDISRTCCTYGVKNYFLINPLDSQKLLFGKIIEFWQTKGRKYQPDRTAALSNIQFCNSYQETRQLVKTREKACPIVITTTAKRRDDQFSFDQCQSLLGNTEQQDKRPVLFLFGTGHGLAEDIHREADIVLEPIDPHANYNHLPVRSAVAIILDRLIPKNKYGGRNGLNTSNEQKRTPNRPA